MLIESKEELRSKVLTMYIEELDLSVRSYNCLKRAGYDTVEQLCEATEEDIISIRNLGRKSCEEVFQKLLSLGICPKKNIPTCETVFDENDNLKEYSTEDGRIIDCDNDFEFEEDVLDKFLAEENDFTRKNDYSDDEYCHSTCEFYNLCYANHTYCIKRNVDEILDKLTLYESSVLKMLLGWQHSSDFFINMLPDEFERIYERMEKIKCRALRKLRYPKREEILKQYLYDAYVVPDSFFYANLLNAVFDEDGYQQLNVRLKVDYRIVDKEKNLHKSIVDIRNELHTNIAEFNELQTFLAILNKAGITTLEHLLYTPDDILLYTAFEGNDILFRNLIETLSSMGYKVR